MAITDASVARAETVESELEVRLPEDYKKFMMEEDGFYLEDDLAVYGYDGEMSHDDPRCVIGATRRFREEFPDEPQSYVVISHDKLNMFPVVLDTENGTIHNFIDGKKVGFHKSFDHWHDYQLTDEKYRCSYEMNRQVPKIEAILPYKSEGLKILPDPKIELHIRQIQATRDLRETVERAGVDTIEAIQTTGEQHRETLDKVGTGIQDAIVKKGDETILSIGNLANKTSQAIEKHREESIKAIVDTTHLEIRFLDETSETLVATINKVGADNVAAVNAASQSSTFWSKAAIGVAFIVGFLGAIGGTLFTQWYTNRSNQNPQPSHFIQQPAPQTPQPIPQVQPPIQKIPQKKTPSPQTPRMKPDPTNKDVDSSGAIGT